MPRDVNNDVTISSRAGYDWSRATTTTTVDDTSRTTLTVTQATKHDSGEFTCSASNGLGDVVTQTAVLIVKCMYIQGTCADVVLISQTSALLLCKHCGAIAME